MEIGNWPATAELNGVVRDARRLGLESHLFELEAYGFTVVEPEKIGSDLPRRLLETTMRLSEEADSLGERMRGPACTDAEYSRLLPYLVGRDPVYAEAIMHPVTLTIARYLLGTSCRLFSSAAFVKRGTAPSTHLHVDSQGNPPPLYPYSVVCNISWVLTDYSEHTGTFAIVPGSHRYCRHPTVMETPRVMGGTADDICIPVAAPPGSLVAFTGNTWHGTYPKKDDGWRAHVVTGFCRNYLLPSEDYRDIADDVIAPHGPELARLLGRGSWQGYKTEGPRAKNIAALSRASITPSA
jgi:hypothetical protein